MLFRRTLNITPSAAFGPELLGRYLAASRPAGRLSSHEADVRWDLAGDNAIVEGNW